MFLRWRPEGEEPTDFEFNLPGFKVPEREAIEAATGLTWGQWKVGLGNESTKAIRALIWTLRRRQHPALRYEDVDFCDADFDMGLDATEVEEARLAILTNPALNQEARDMALLQLNEAAGIAPAGPGKAPAPSDEPSTPSP